MGQERFAYLFQKYVDKSCSSEERAEFMDMLNGENYSVDFDALVDKLWNTIPDIELEEQVAQEIFVKVLASDESDKRSKLNFKPWMAWAALIFIIGAAVLLFLPGKSLDPVQTKSNTIVHSKATVSPEPQVITAYGEHKKITLPDGSTVVLNNKSTLEYPAAFNALKREVILRGEGYFDIKHDDKRTFIVHSGKINTIVLGTAFNIKAYENENSITVTVSRGKVSVQNDKQLLGVITPNQQITFDKKYKNSNLVNVKAKEIVQWQEKDLFFDDVSMEEAVSILSKRFNTTIGFANERTKNCRFTATFLKGESLDEILKVICSFNNAQYQTLAGAITIKGEGCE